MNPKVTIHKIKDRSPEWHTFRGKYLTSSEFATAIGLNEWEEPIQWYYRKLGVEPTKKDSMPMFLGREEEDLIARMWEYWTGDVDEFLDNWSKGEKVRNLTSVGGIITHSDYGGCSSTLDRVSHKGMFRISDGSLSEKAFPVECKRMSGWVAKKYEDDFPIYNKTQLAHQITMWDEGNYGEFSCLNTDGKYMVLPLEVSNVEKKIILERSKEIWHDTFLPAREASDKHIKKYGQWDYSNVPEEVQNLEPDAVNPLKYQEFWKDRFKPENDTSTNASMEALETARTIKEYQAVSKVVESKIAALRGSIEAEMREKKVGKLWFDEVNNKYVKVNTWRLQLDHEAKEYKEAVKQLVNDKDI